MQNSLRTILSATAVIALPSLLAACDGGDDTSTSNGTGGSTSSVTSSTSAGTGGAGGQGTGGAGGAGGAGGVVECDPGPTEKGKRVDLLFDIDNSRSMVDKQEVLALVIKDVVQALTNPPCVDGSGMPSGAQPHRR
jgi:hypothetical protein